MREQGIEVCGDNYAVKTMWRILGAPTQRAGRPRGARGRQCGETSADTPAHTRAHGLPRAATWRNLGEPTQRTRRPRGAHWQARGAHERARAATRRNLGESTQRTKRRLGAHERALGGH